MAEATAAYEEGAIPPIIQRVLDAQASPYFPSFQAAMIKVAEQAVEEKWPHLEMDVSASIRITTADKEELGERTSYIVKDAAYAVYDQVHQVTVILSQLKSVRRNEHAAGIPLNGETMYPNYLSIMWCSDAAAYHTERFQFSFLVNLAYKENIDDSVDTKPARAC